MAYEVLLSSTATPLLFFLTASSDHLTGLTGASPTVTISKNGSTTFSSPAGTITEMGSGWYKLAPTNADTNTLGPLALHASSSLSDACDMVAANIVAYDPRDASRLGLTGLSTVAPGAAGGLFIAGSNAATTVNITGNITGNLSGSVGSVTARVTANTDQLNGQTVTATTGVTFPSSVAGTTNITSGTITTVSGNVSGSVGSIAAGGITSASFASSAIDAAALATSAAQEIRDAILNQTLSELVGDPGATPAVKDAIMLQHMALRNLRVTSSTGSDKITNDAGATILTAAITDDSTAFTKAKYA